MISDENNDIMGKHSCKLQNQQFLTQMREPFWFVALHIYHSGLMVIDTIFSV